MRQKNETKTRRRAPLSRERVLQTAVALADDGGIEGLSMRRLGQELGVEAMSLYNHVANKDDMLAGILGLVLDEVELPEEEDWRGAMRRHAISAHDAFRRHAWACSLALAPAPRRPVPQQVEQMEWKLRRLRAAGFSAGVTYHALHALDGHIMGFTLWELSHMVTTGNVKDLAATFLQQFPATRYPNLHEHVEQHVTGFGRGQKPAFEFGLDLILDGLERLRDAASNAR